MDLNVKLPLTNVNNLGNKSSTKLLYFIANQSPISHSTNHIRILFQGQNAFALLIYKLYFYFMTLFPQNSV